MPSAVSSTSQPAQPQLVFPSTLPLAKDDPNGLAHDLPSNCFTLRQTAQLAALLTIIRDRSTSRGDFVFTSNRIIRLLVEEGLNNLPVVPKEIITPLGEKHVGVGFQGKIAGVSIMRAGEAMETGLRECARSVRLGKILIQRDEETAQAKLYYAKVRALPSRRSLNQVADRSFLSRSSRRTLPRATASFLTPWCAEDDLPSS